MARFRAAPNSASLSTATLTEPTVHTDRSRSPSRATTRTLHRLLANRSRSLRINPRRLINIRIVRAPHQIAEPYAFATDRAIPKAQFAPLDLKDATALFRLLRTPPVSRIEHHAIAQA